MQIGRMNRYNDLAYLYRKKEKEKRRIDNDLSIIKQLKLDVERDLPSNPLMERTLIMELNWMISYNILTWLFMTRLLGG